MEAPSVPDERRFYAEILRQVFAPFRASKSAGQLQYEVPRLLATVEVKPLIGTEQLTVASLEHCEYVAPSQ